MAKGKKIGQITVGSQRGFRGYMDMMKAGKSSSKIFRMTGQKAYIRQPKRTKTGWTLGIFEKK